MPFLSNGANFYTDFGNIGNTGAYSSPRASTSGYIWFLSVYVTNTTADDCLARFYTTNSVGQIHSNIIYDGVVRAYSTFTLFSKENIGYFSATDTARGFRIENTTANTTLNIRATYLKG